MIEIIQAETTEHIEEARALFREYEASINLDLCFQSFDEELAGLPGKYAAPEGRLLLAFADEKLAGCIALRKLEPEICEMKRLFVRDRFRGQKIGIALIEKVFSEARAIGYEIPSYYHNPFGETLFMEKDLSAED